MALSGVGIQPQVLSLVYPALHQLTYLLSPLNLHFLALSKEFSDRPTLSTSVKDDLDFIYLLFKLFIKFDWCCDYAE